MPVFEYKVLPAPNRPKRKKGVKGNSGRFAFALEEAINEAAAEGWEYLRADSMPVQERQGLMRSAVETYHTVLIFRREAAAPVVQDEEIGLIEDHSKTAVATAATAAVASVADAEPPVATDAPQSQAEPAISEDNGQPDTPSLRAEREMPPPLQPQPVRAEDADPVIAQPEGRDRFPSR